MSLSTFLLRAPRCTAGLSHSLTRSHQTVFLVARKYSTHRDPSLSSSLSQSLDQTQRTGPKHERVGPFQLGLAQKSLPQSEKVQKWSELSTGGKVGRTAARTSNLAVILLGAGLSAMLIYALTTELFSKNSPTVLYGDACERIKASARVAKYLNGPLVFHNSPPSAVRPRHRDRHVSSQVFIDSYGREHMLLDFYVQGRPPGHKASPSQSSYFNDLSEWAQNLTWDESIEWAKQRGAIAQENLREAFKYLSGAPPSPSPPSAAPSQDRKETHIKEESTAWSFAGMFSSLKGSRGGSVETHSEPDGNGWTDGEVHADLIRNNEGYFVFRYLFIDIPDSRSRNPIRVWVERAAGVRDNEPIVRWS